MKIKLKSRVRDVLTGFEGFVTARCEYMNGCIQYEVIPAELKDGRPQKALWLDEEQLKVVKVEKKLPKFISYPLDVEAAKAKRELKKKGLTRDSLLGVGRRKGGPQNTPDHSTPPASYGEEQEDGKD